MSREIVTFEVDSRNLFAAIEELQAANGRSKRTLMMQQSKLLMKQVIDITPPAGGGVTGREARKRGEEAIDFDLGNVFEAVRLKGRRKVTQAFGKKLKKPVYVPTRELHPDVRAIWNVRRASSYDIFGRVGRGRRQAWYVDRGKLDALERTLKSRVGKLASGWVPAVRKLGVRGVANWITNKSNGGTVRLDIGRTGDLDFNATAPVKGKLLQDLQRRINAAMAIRAATIRRQIPFILAANAKKALGQ